MSDTQNDSAAVVSIYDARPFFEKALQYGVQHGILSQDKLDEIARTAPKGMVQIAAYFGSEFLRPELERARDRIVNLVSLYLEQSCDGDLRKAAESLRDHSFLSRSKGGSDMLKRLITMPQSSHFAMNERQEFSDVHIPQLSKWTLRPLSDYRAELARRTHAQQLMDAALWLAEDLGAEPEELTEAGCEAEAVIRTALLVLNTRHTEMPDWRTFGNIVLKLRNKHGTDASGIQLHIPGDIPDHLLPVTTSVRDSVLADLPSILDPAIAIRKLFQQTPKFMGRYFWIDSGLAEVDQHERAVSATWKKATGGDDDEASLLTLFLTMSVGGTGKTVLTERTAGTLVRKLRKTGSIDAQVAETFIRAHAPTAYQADYLKLWQSFLEEARATLVSDADYELKAALALLRRECNVKAP